MGDWIYLNKHRLRTGPLGSDPEMGFNGAFAFSMPGEPRRIFCVASDGSEMPDSPECQWRHVSVSFGSASRRPPSWEVMCFVKDLFYEEEELVMQLHPRASQYVNSHQGCLHLWSPKPPNAAIPEPHYLLVGLDRKYHRHDAAPVSGSSTP